MDLNRAN